MHLAKQHIHPSRVFQHILFWGLSYYILLRIFSTGSQPHNIDYIYTLLFHLPLLIGVYVNLQLLVPKLLGEEKYLLYSFGVAGLILATTQLNLLFFDYLIDILFPGYYFISYYEFIDVVQFFLIYIFITSLLKLSRGWFHLAKTEKELAAANRQHLESELKVLKSQINPHFLFNSLNNLYSLSLKGDAQTPAFILKLSESLRYILYECEEDLVLLENEIIFLRNFVDLQKLRSLAGTTIDFNVTGDTREIKVAPLLFMPFVENGFKHGVKGDTKSGFIKIDLAVEKKQLLFQVENNQGSIDEGNIGKEGGIGLENVQQRLQLIYPDKHRLDIMNSEQNFKVTLKLNLA